MNLEYFSLTHTGRVRENNEDSVVLDPAHQLAVLADGMGGYNAGEVASAMATSLIATEMSRWLSGAGAQASMREHRRALSLCVADANSAIFNAAQTSEAHAGMGTTLVVGLFQPDRALIAHVGDSRCYRLRGRTLERLTRDHSLLQEQIDAGLVSPKYAPFVAYKNLITRALGVEPQVMLDMGEFRLAQGDLFLLCSDGLSDMLSDERMAALLCGRGTIEEKGHSLVDAANAKGGKDNISVILVQVRPAPDRRSFISRIMGH